MKTVTLTLLVCVVAVATGYYMPKEVKFADNNFLMKQKAIFEVLQHVHQKEVHTKLWEDSKTFDLKSSKAMYPEMKEDFDKFWALYEHGMLAHEEIFSIMHKEHREQAIYLFKLFFYAKDWDTFYKTMVWARFHVNEEMFVYSLTCAVLHRPDMVGMILPAMYEIMPYHFFNDEVIQEAHSYKMQGFYGMKKAEDNTFSVVIPSNYTGWYIHMNPDQKLSYFCEDIGLNGFYYYFAMDYPFWMGGEDFDLKKDRRGEHFLFTHQQLLARYYMERLSNDLGRIPEMSFYEPIKTGYYPAMRYYNGAHFPSRDNNWMMYNEHDYYELEFMEDHERRIRDAVDMGFFLKKDGTHMEMYTDKGLDYLGNIIQGNPDGFNHRYYGNILEYATMLMGASYEHFEDNKVIPSVMEHFETAMRDPVYWQYWGRILKMFYQHFNEHMPKYTKDELMFKGVKIEGIEMDKLTTYFDKFDADITNAVDVEVYDEKMGEMGTMKKFGKMAHYQGEDFMIKARQYRLNHLPFTFKMMLNSDKAQKAIVKMFIGPKYDQYGNTYHIEDNRHNFFKLDTFMVELTPGKNVIERKSEEFSWFVKDRTTYYELYKNLMMAIKGEKQFPLDMTEAHCGFPMRLMLPKGKKGGMPFQFFFMVTPYMKPEIEKYTGYDPALSCGVGSGARWWDKYSFGYPFDREIDETYWYTPNMYFYDTLIYHKKDTEINAVN